MLTTGAATFAGLLVIMFILYAIGMVAQEYFPDKEFAPATLPSREDKMAAMYNRRNSIFAHNRKDEIKPASYEIIDYMMSGDNIKWNDAVKVLTERKAEEYDQLERDMRAKYNIQD